eukprot:scaffold69_cov248-Pinguiococcus_pyrenoidosus.AAC.50
MEARRDRRQILVYASCRSTLPSAASFRAHDHALRAPFREETRRAVREAGDAASGQQKRRVRGGRGRGGVGRRSRGVRELGYLGAVGVRGRGVCAQLAPHRGAVQRGGAQSASGVLLARGRRAAGVSAAQSGAAGHAVPPAVHDAHLGGGHQLSALRRRRGEAPPVQLSQRRVGQVASGGDRRRHGLQQRRGRSAGEGLERELRAQRRVLPETGCGAVQQTSAARGAGRAAASSLDLSALVTARQP